MESYRATLTLRRATVDLEAAGGMCIYEEQRFAPTRAKIAYKSTTIQLRKGVCQPDPVTLNRTIGHPENNRPTTRHICAIPQCRVDTQVVSIVVRQ